MRPTSEIAASPPIPGRAPSAPRRSRRRRSDAPAAPQRSRPAQPETFTTRGYDSAMGEFEFSASAKSTATPDQVWAVLSNPASWRSWWKQWEDAEADAPLAEGTVVRASRLAADVSDR